MSIIKFLEKQYGIKPVEVKEDYKKLSDILKINVGDDFPFDDDIFIIYDNKIVKNTWVYKSDFLYDMITKNVEKIIFVKRNKNDYKIEIINVMMDVEEMVKIELFKKLYNKDYKITEEELKNIWWDEEDAKKVFNNLAKKFEDEWEEKAYKYEKGIYCLEFEFLRWLIRDYMNYEIAKPTKEVLTIIKGNKVIIIKENGRKINIVY